jgi:hypothetical protein
MREEALADSGRVAPALGAEGEVVISEMGFPHHRSVKAIARTIEALSPEDGNFLAKKFLPQAALYIRRPRAAKTIDDIVEEQLLLHLGETREVERVRFCEYWRSNSALKSPSFEKPPLERPATSPRVHPTT